MHVFPLTNRVPTLPITQYKKIEQRQLVFLKLHPIVWTFSNYSSISFVWENFVCHKCYTTQWQKGTRNIGNIHFSSQFRPLKMLPASVWKKYLRRLCLSNFSLLPVTDGAPRIWSVNLQMGQFSKFKKKKSGFIANYLFHCLTLLNNQWCPMGHVTGNKTTFTIRMH